MSAAVSEAFTFPAVTLTLPVDTLTFTADAVTSQFCGRHFDQDACWMLLPYPFHYPIPSFGTVSQKHSPSAGLHI